MRQERAWEGNEERCRAWRWLGSDVVGLGRGAVSFRPCSTPLGHLRPCFCGCSPHKRTIAAFFRWWSVLPFLAPCFFSSRRPPFLRRLPIHAPRFSSAKDFREGRRVLRRSEINGQTESQHWKTMCAARDESFVTEKTTDYLNYVTLSLQI